MTMDAGPHYDAYIFYDNNDDQSTYIGSTGDELGGLWAAGSDGNGDWQSVSEHFNDFGMNVDLNKTPTMRPSLPYQLIDDQGEEYGIRQDTQIQQFLHPINQQENFQQPQQHVYTPQDPQMHLPGYYDHQLTLPQNSYTHEEAQFSLPNYHDQSSLHQSSFIPQTQDIKVFLPNHYDQTSLDSNPYIQRDHTPNFDLNMLFPNTYHGQNNFLENNRVDSNIIATYQPSHQPSYQPSSVISQNQHYDPTHTQGINHSSDIYETGATSQFQPQQVDHDQTLGQHYERYYIKDYDKFPLALNQFPEVSNLDDLTWTCTPAQSWYHIPAANAQKIELELEPPPFSTPRIVDPIPNPYSLIDRLPKEVHILICEYLGPKELWKWAILRVNNFTHTMTDRGLWCRILRRFCKHNSIHYNFFPIDNYTYWGIVRFFAEWPMQWRHKLAGKPREGELHGDLPGNNCVRKFDCRAPELQTKPARHNFCMRLVPGGRYLVVDDTRTMNIWDLGLGAGAECVCLASVIHELPKGTNRKRAKLEVYPAPDGHDFRVLVFFPTFTPKSGDVESDIGAYEIYNVHPPNPIYSKNDKLQINLIAKAFHEERRGLYAVTGDLYARFFPETNTLTVWNIISGTMESIDIQNSSDERVERIIIRETPRIGIPILIVVKMSHIAIYGFSPCLLDSDIRYEIPKELSSSNATLIIPTNFLEQVNSDFSEDMNSYGSPFFDFPPRWYETSDRPLIMDLVCCSTKGKKYQHRWRYEISFDISTTTVELSGSVSLLRKLFSEYLPYQRNFGFSDDHIFLGCVKSNEAAVTFGLATPDNPPVSSSFSGQLASSHNGASLSFKESKSALLLRREVKHDMDMMRGFELCVISGRICFFTRAQPYIVCIIDQYTLDQPVDE